MTSVQTLEFFETSNSSTSKPELFTAKAINSYTAKR